MDAGTSVSGPGGATTLPTEPCVGVLFVHGAGDHHIGSTLLEFGRPLVEWLDGWLRAGGPRPDYAGDDLARPGAGQILVREADAAAPAHVAVKLSTRDPKSTHLWLLAESRWDQAFQPPNFQQVLLWSLSVVPWTLLTQVIAPLIDEWHVVRANFFSILRFVIETLVGIVLALILSLILQLLAIVVLVLSIIPLDPVRDLVGTLQRFLSSSVGDLYIVLMSPIERAALAGAVQRDILALRKLGCDKVVVVAHSQGGFVSYEALSDPWHPQVDRLITLGSGVIRLTESEQAKRRGWLLPALLGTLGLLLAVRFAFSALATVIGFGDPHPANLLAFIVGAFMAVGIVWSIRTYLKKREPVRPLPDPVPWFDFLTRKDPVVNGPIGDRLPVPNDHRVNTWNRASITGDHGSYWDNRDQFVAQVARRIGELDHDLDLMAVGPPLAPKKIDSHLQRSYKRRKTRVKALARTRMLVAFATVALLLVRAYQLEAVGNPVADGLDRIPLDLISWLPDPIEGILPLALDQRAVVGALVIAVIAFVAFRIAVWFWDGWGDADTESQWAGRKPQRDNPRAVAFHAWLLAVLAAIAIVAAVGLERTVAFIGDLLNNLDGVAQSLARYYGAALVVSVGLFVLVRAIPVGDVAPVAPPAASADSSRPAGSRSWRERVTDLLLDRPGIERRQRLSSALILGWIFGGVVALVLATLDPGESELPRALLIGLGLDVVATLGVLLAIAAWPRAAYVLGRVRRFVARLVDLGPKNSAMAQPPDLLGVVALALPVVAVGLTIFATAAAIIMALLNGLAGLALSIVMAMRGTRRHLRVIGVLGAVACVAAMAYAVVTGAQHLVA
jgi:hypothetical protein